MTDPTDDDFIELAAALEMRRALHIVAEVAALPVGGKDALSPSPFHAGYQLACEEIAERIRTQQVVIPDGAVLPLCGPLPSIAQPAITTNSTGMARAVAPTADAPERIRVEGPVNPGEKHLRYRLRRPSESLEAYRIAMGWDAQP